MKRAASYNTYFLHWDAILFFRSMHDRGLTRFSVDGYSGTLLEVVLDHNRNSQSVRICWDGPASKGSPKIEDLKIRSGQHTEPGSSGRKFEVLSPLEELARAAE